MKNNFIQSFTDFGKGFIAGVIISAIVFGLVVGFIVHRTKVKELIEYAERQEAFEQLREDYVNRDPHEFFEIPGVRGSADGAAAEFERKRDGALERFRNRLVD